MQRVKGKADQVASRIPPWPPLVGLCLKWKEDSDGKFFYTLFGPSKSDSLRKADATPRTIP